MELKTLSSEVETARKSLSCWRGLVARAFGKAGLSQKRGASDLGITEGQLSRQLSGGEHLSFWRMFTLPPEFWAELVDLICEFHQLPPRGLTAQDEEFRRIGKAYCELQAMVARAQR